MFPSPNDIFMITYLLTAWVGVAANAFLLVFGKVCSSNLGQALAILILVSRGSPQFLLANYGRVPDPSQHYSPITLYRYWQLCNNDCLL
jgi:hypothetical protein